VCAAGPGASPACYWPGLCRPGGGAAATGAGGAGAELDDARGSRDDDLEHSEDSGEQQGHAEWQVAVHAEEADRRVLAVSRMKISSNSRTMAKARCTCQRSPVTAGNGTTMLSPAIR
jgi:hypothetical protein